MSRTNLAGRPVVVEGVVGPSVGKVTSVWNRPGYSFRADDVVPLPIDTFGDPDWYAREQHSVLRPGGGMLYVGHDVLMPGK